MSTKEQELKLYTDGASRGNPGQAGAGVLVCDSEDNPISECSVFLGEVTNNVAEYQALLIGLEEAFKFTQVHLSVFMDSELIVRQIQGKYRVRSKDLLPLYLNVQKWLSRFKQVTIQHIRREYNQKADRLANRAIDERLRT